MGGGMGGGGGLGLAHLILNLSSETTLLTERKWTTEHLFYFFMLTLFVLPSTWKPYYIFLWFESVTEFIK